MSKRDYITRYLLIVKKLRTSGYASFKEINQFIISEFELIESPKDISLRTFQRDLNDIRSLFGIDIQCNTLNQYYIAEDDNSGFNNRMIEAFDLINALNVGQNLSPHVLLEKRCPLGTEHIFGLLHAIRNRIIVRFTYEKFTETEITVREADPFALKEFRGRWYLLAKDQRDDHIKTFALDRIHDLEITKKRFAFPKDLNPEEYFRNCFGVISSPDDNPQEVVLSFDPFQGKYIKSYPLHESQKILKYNSDELLISLTIFVTHDFFMELLSYGDNVKVIRPASLVDDLKISYQSALNQY